MSKLDWSKVGIRVSDPARILDGGDYGILPDRLAGRKGNSRRHIDKVRKKSTSAEDRETLLVPLDKIHLIMSVMKDMNRPLPMSVKRLNKALRQLIMDKVILLNGDFNRKHPLLQRWLARIEQPPKKRPKRSRR